MKRTTPIVSLSIQPFTGNVFALNGKELGQKMRGTQESLKISFPVLYPVAGGGLH